MLECGTTNREPAKTVHKTGTRFDPRRIYTVLFVVPLLYGAIRYLPPSLFTGIVALAGCVSLFELYRLCVPSLSRSWAVGIGLLGCIALIVGPHQPALLQTALLAAVVAVLSIPLLVEVPLPDSFRDAAIVITGMLYVGLTLSYLVVLRLLPQGASLLFFLLLVTWAADTAAYYVGTLYGQRKLAPKISPKKTVEGLAGGLVGATIVAYAARWSFLPEFSLFDTHALAVLLTVAGLWGDLVESAIKRGAGVKDSGGLLPGHGGMLDRLDSLLFTAPAFYYYVTFLGRAASHP
ncbi:MAG TPA: phosphatidate cytidylyltransferase [Nitrospiraceae bacterium]|jgi:phosphatidate cytidylyltransferase|nr:phosphatidate cytidylyltransferase [Nitrospiraceae bacterium]